MSKKNKKQSKPRIKVTGDDAPAVQAIAPAQEATTAPKKLSALNAAAQVLAEADQPLNAKEIIERMTAAGLWTSPAGKTPHATIYAAIIRHIAKHGEASPFRKAARGKFSSAS